MKVYTCTKFSGRWPVGTAAVMIADCPNQALRMLNNALKAQGLAGDAKLTDIEHLKTRTPDVRLLATGEY